MNHLIKLAAAAAAGALTAGTIVYAQAPAAAPPRAIVTLYRAAPGQQVALLHYLADQDRVAAASGLPAGQLYVHTDGDSWDYMGIRPVTTAAQDQALDAAAAKMNLPSGPRASIEFRKTISSHTDTYTVGPVTAAQALHAVGE